MNGVIRKWGNSAAVRIPAVVMGAANLRLDQHVEVRAEGGCVVITPVRPASCTLSSLLDGITEDNLHGEISIGNAVGHEVW